MRKSRFSEAQIIAVLRRHGIVQMVEFAQRVVVIGLEMAELPLTTDLPFERWTKIFADEMAATPVIDRLLHHGSAFIFRRGLWFANCDPRGSPPRPCNPVRVQFLNPRYAFNFSSQRGDHR